MSEPMTAEERRKLTTPGWVEPRSEPRTEEWAANGLAALDHLDSLYYAGAAHLTVRDYRAATDVIRSALLARAEAASLALDGVREALRDALLSYRGPWDLSLPVHRSAAAAFTAQVDAVADHLAAALTAKGEPE